MTECPIEAVDYESALVQADWYEENNQLLIADSIRDRLTPYIGTIFRSRSGSRSGSGSRSWSRSGSRSGSWTWSRSWSGSRSRSRNWSRSGSGSWGGSGSGSY